jgi:hypothetical protein
MQWEYKLELNSEESELNDLGRQGWELAAVSPCGKENSYTGFFLKRPKETNSVS